MGKLEKQIMIGALALVGILVAVVILKGLSPREDGTLEGDPGLGAGPALMLDGTTPVEPTPADPLLDTGLDPALQDPNAPLAQLPAQPENWLDLSGVPPAAGAEVPLTDAGLGLDGAITPPSLPPAFEAPPVVTPAPVVKDRYVIRSGDTLGHIAQRELGSARRVKEIMELNPGLDPTNLSVGVEIKLPTTGAAPVKSEATPPVASNDAGFQTHVVVAGDSLWALADRYLRDGNRFREIVAANPTVLKNENSVLPLGAKLRIPKL